MRRLLLVLLLLPAGVAAQERPAAVTIPRIEAEIQVDASLDEPAWQQAALLSGFHQYEPVDGRPAVERTEVRVWYSPDAIHFGILAYDSQPDAVRATQADRDNIDNDDRVTIYLDTFNDRRRAFFFGVNPLGVQLDGVRTEGSGSAGRTFGGNIDDSPDFVFDSRGRLTAEGYTVEVRIPFKSLRFPGSGPQRWGLQVERRVQRLGYTDTWTDARRASASYLVQAGTIDGLYDLRRGIVIETQPFITLNAPGARNFASNEFERADLEPDAGANLRVGFSNMAIDATVNPDFSQVEADAGQVTINQRFALFFPEKRPFFLEGIELFSTPGQLVYTRRIVDPIAGGKVTGKFGPFSVAHLSAVDEDVDAERREALFNVTRIRGEFGSNSHGGLTFTDRTVLDGDAHNRVLAGDLRVVFAKLYFVEGQWGGSWTRREEGPSLTSAIWKAEFDRTGHAWGFNYSLSGVGESFRADAGFVNRPGVVSARAMNRLTYYGPEGALVELAQVFFGPNRLWQYRDFGSEGAIEGGESANSSVRLRGGWNIELNLGRNFVTFLPEEYQGYTVQGVDGAAPFVLPEGISGPTASLEINTPTYQRFDASLEFGRNREAIFDEASEGTGTAVELDLDLRPRDDVRVGLSTEYRLLNRSRDGGEFARAIIPRISAEFQPTRALFFRAITEYRAERRAALLDPHTGAPLLIDGELADAAVNNGLRLDLLASYEPTPGTVAYLGYGSSYSELLVTDRRRLDRVNDGFFLKIAYQFRN
jgi:hypothetical protein